MTIKGPKVDAPAIALEGFIKSNNIIVQKFLNKA
jgi:hypothetical protein